MPPEANLYDRLLDFEALLRAHKKTRLGKRYKTDVMRFELSLNCSLHQLKRELGDGTYRVGTYQSFVVREPKVRRIHTLPYCDRVVQRLICDEALVPLIEPKLIYDCAACRKGKGTHFALHRLGRFMREHWNRHGLDGWVLKGDIASYFASVDHGVLKKKLRKNIKDERFLALLEGIIDGSPAGAGKGLPLGNMTSQWFSNWYLDPLDRLVKERLRVHGYSRYMDDFVLIGEDRDYLNECLRHIRALVECKLKLSLNAKTQIFPLRHGVDYLGFHSYLGDRGQVVRVLRHDSVRRMKRKLKFFQAGYTTGEVDMERVEQSLYSWLGHAEHGDTWNLRKKLLERFAFNRGGVSDEDIEEG